MARALAAGGKKDLIEELRGSWWVREDQVKSSDEASGLLYTSTLLPFVLRQRGSQDEKQRKQNWRLVGWREEEGGQGREQGEQSLSWYRLRNQSNTSEVTKAGEENQFPAQRSVFWARRKRERGLVIRVEVEVVEQQRSTQGYPISFHCKDGLTTTHTDQTSLSAALAILYK